MYTDIPKMYLQIINIPSHCITFYIVLVHESVSFHHVLMYYQVLVLPSISDLTERTTQQEGCWYGQPEVTHHGDRANNNIVGIFVEFLVEIHRYSLGWQHDCCPPSRQEIFVEVFGGQATSIQGIQFCPLGADFLLIISEFLLRSKAFVYNSIVWPLFENVNVIAGKQ